MNDFFNGLPQPKTYLQEILLTAILQNTISKFDFTYLGDFRKYVSDLKLKHNIIFKIEEKTKVTKYGNSYTYREHTLTNKDHATNVYLEMCKDN